MLEPLFPHNARIRPVYSETAGQHIGRQRWTCRCSCGLDLGTHDSQQAATVQHIRHLGEARLAARRWATDRPSDQPKRQ